MTLRSPSTLEMSRRSPPGITQLFDDPDLRAMLSAAGLTRATRFTWEATARSTAEAMRAAHEVAHG